ncbi:MAG: hypothetical protein AB1551_07265 [Actinomycetota bacterium]
MTRELDWALLEKAVDVTASAVRGTLGAENSQPPKFAADVFREVWTALKDAAAELPERGKPGF